MDHLKNITDHIHVRLAQNEDEIRQAQALRYRVFYEEYGAQPNAEVAAQKRDFDVYDTHAQHLVVVDEKAQGPNGQKGAIVGTYRLIGEEAAQSCGQYYSSDEYDLSVVRNTGLNVLELGRSCVLSDYRSRPVLQLLWQGITDFFIDNNIDLMFGCASMHSTDMSELALPLSYLYHYHLADEEVRATALPARFIDMNIIPKDQIDVKKAFALLPPLIKGYLRAGAMVGNGAVLDEQFNTTDIFIIVRTHAVTDRYKKHYERKTQKTIGGGDNAKTDVPPLNDGGNA